jgi:hypothetical protein
MLSKPTTFVIGAGASCEFGLPDGPALITKIAASLDIQWDRRERHFSKGDAQIAETFRHASAGTADGWHEACWRIRDGLPGLADSIDSYLDNHRDDVDMQRVGRAAIVKRILEAEKASKLAIDRRRSPAPPLDCTHVADTWIGALFRTLQRRCDRSGVSSFFNNCHMIVFNYDRCIEQYFEHAISQHYHIAHEHARAIVAAASIVHVYGTVGALPGYSVDGDECVPFGSTEVNLIEVSQRIRTYTENTSDKTIAEAIGRFMHDCEVLVFLGFAFHPQNLDMLQIPARRHNPVIIGTAYNVSHYNRRRFVHDLASRFSPSGDLPEIVAVTCGDLMRDYSGAFDR